MTTHQIVETRLPRARHRSNAGCRLFALRALAVACAAAFAIAPIAHGDTGGVVTAWGANWNGQCDIPTDAQSGVTAIAGGYGHTIALKSTGSVLAWGYNWAGQCTVPTAAQSGVTAIAGGEHHTIALKSTGSVLAWGANWNGQCDIPTDAQSGVTAIAGGVIHTIALKSTGRVLAWGYNSGGQCNITIDAQSGVTAIAGGGSHTIALLEAFRDCNNNGIHDSIDISTRATDLNHDRVPDACQGAVEYAVTSPSLGVPTANTPVSFIFTNLVTPDNFAGVPIVISTKGDFDAANEFLTVKVNGVTLGRVYESGGVNCSDANGGVSTASLTIPFATFAAAAATGQITITLLPSPAVTAAECGNGWMNVELNYLGIGPDGDCNSNGVLDTRDLGTNPSLDCDQNGQLDTCELAVDPLTDCDSNGVVDECDIAAGSSDEDLDHHPDACQYAKGDLDLSGSVDTGDFGILLLYFGEVDPVFGDFDGSGVIDNGDLAVMLLFFGDVMWP